MNYLLWLLYNVYIYSKESFVILCCRCNMLEIIKFLIEGLIMGFLGLFGIVGNVVSIAVLSSTELDMMPAFRHLMKMLGAFDAIFLVIKWELGSIFYTSFTTRLCLMDYLTYLHIRSYERTLGSHHVSKNVTPMFSKIFLWNFFALIRIESHF